ncbi:MAG: GPP34 family phosphoprotein [Phycisphaerales bacterium]|nr:GPP34 family phosphoprotein [Phycisphaerales bacterium]
MGSPAHLHVYQELLLLALRDERGTPLGSWGAQALAGGVIADLALAGRISLEGKRAIVHLENAEPMEDPVLDAAMLRLAEAKRRAAASTWVQRFATGKTFHMAAGRLCELGVLRADTEKVLLIFDRRVYPEINPEPEREVVERMREAIFTEREDIDAPTVLLVSIASATELLGAHFPKKELRARKKRIEGLKAGDAVGQAAAKAVEAVRAAIMVAVIMPAIAGAAS